MERLCYAVAPAIAFTFTCGFTFGCWLHQLNADVTDLFTGKTFHSGGG